MIRRRVLGGMIDFGVRVNGSKFLPENETIINYDYGIKKIIKVDETGSYVGNSIPTYEVIDNDIYYKLGVSSKGTENIAILNFKTYLNNQTVNLEAKVNSDSPGDFLAFCKLDDNDILHLHKKISGNITQNIQTISYNVATAGSHFIKVYYYQNHDNNVASTTQNKYEPNAGYFRLVSYKYEYENGYINPEAHGYLNNNSEYSIFVRSYYDWYVFSKPEWVSSIEYRNSTTNGQSTLANVGSSNRVHRGKSELSIYVKANHGLSRTGDIVLKEIKRRSSSKPEQTVIIHISQEANPKPNDIIVTLDKAEVPTAKTLTATGAKALSVNVKLFGYTDYTASCVDTTNMFSITKGDLTQLNVTDITNYKDMSVKSGTLIIKKTDNSEITGNPIKINIIGTNGYNTTDIQKYIDIKSDTISCYCDCYLFNRCNCDIEYIYYNKIANGSNYDSCNDAWSRHDHKLYPNTTCWCDCNLLDKCSKTIHCNAHVYCTDCSSDSKCDGDDSCTSYSTGCTATCKSVVECESKTMCTDACGAHCSGDSTADCDCQSAKYYNSTYIYFKIYLEYFGISDEVMAPYVEFTLSKNNSTYKVKIDSGQLKINKRSDITYGGRVYIDDWGPSGTANLSLSEEWYGASLQKITVWTVNHSGANRKFIADVQDYGMSTEFIDKTNTWATSFSTHSADTPYYIYVQLKQDNPSTWGGPTTTDNGPDTICNCDGHASNNCSLYCNDSGYQTFSCQCEGNECSCYTKCTVNCTRDVKESCNSKGSTWECSSDDVWTCICETKCNSHCKPHCANTSCSTKSCSSKTNNCACNQVGYRVQCGCHTQCQCENYYEPTDNCNSKTYSCTGKYNFKTNSCVPYCQSKECGSNCQPEYKYPTICSKCNCDNNNPV